MIPIPIIMYDSVSPEAIPRNAPAVAGYVDGLYAWDASDWARFSGYKITISAVGRTLARVFDVEPGGIWPITNVIPLVVAAREAGIPRVTVYCNLSHLAAAQAAFRNAGVPLPDFWVARYDGHAEIPGGTIGKQFAAPEGSGPAKAAGHYDVSYVDEPWAAGQSSGSGGASPAPKPQEEDVALITTTLNPPPATPPAEGYQWASLAVPPVGGSLSVGPKGQAWVHLHVPNQPAKVEVWRSIGGVGALLEVIEIQPDQYVSRPLPQGVTGLSFLYVEGTRPVSVVVETFRGE